jgi:hypothetical protein
MESESSLPCLFVPILGQINPFHNVPTYIFNSHLQPAIIRSIPKRGFPEM